MYTISMKNKKILKVRDRVLKLLSGKLDGFYLAGGTALSLFYFHHRESYDLDFFAREFSRETAGVIMKFISSQTGYESKLIGEEGRNGFAAMMVYALKIDKESALRIDFVQDFYPLREPLKEVDGIKVLSIPDIYLRKIIAVCGNISAISEPGRRVFVGGRQEAKDFFDLYFLSKTFMPLSKFVAAYCPLPQKESVVVWYRSYGRLAIKSGLADIITDKVVSYQEMERYFKQEVDNIVKSEL